MKVRQARNLLDFLGKAVSGENTPYGLLLRGELESFRRSSDSYLFHEHLEDDNSPVYFFQFAERVAAHGLRYLGEADFRVMVPGNYPPEIENVLQMLSQDVVHLEQYMDFLRNRMFRQTLLCHKNVVPNYNLRWEQIRQFHVGSPAVAVDEKQPIASTEASVFKSPDGVVLQARVPLAKAAMKVLSEVWPCFMAFRDLFQRSRERLRLAGGTLGEAAADEKLLAETLLSFYASASSSLIDLSICPPAVTGAASERPKASPLAVLQACRQNHVTNLRHETVWLGDFERAIVSHLDGSIDRRALVAALIGDFDSGAFQIEKDGEQIEDRPSVETAIREMLEQQLAFIARSALLLE